MSWWWWLGLVVGIIACLFISGGMLLVLGVIAIGVPSAMWQRWRDERRRVTWTAPGIGDLSSVDRQMWVGEREGLTLMFETDGGPPSPAQLHAYRAIREDLARLAGLAHDYFQKDEDTRLYLRELTDSGEFRVRGLMIEDAARFTAILEHTADEMTAFHVDFVAGRPVAVVILN